MTSTSVDIPVDLASALGAERTAEWSRERGPQEAIAHIERIDGRLVAAVLTTRRPATLVSKIADAWQREDDERADDALDRLLRTLVSDAEARGDIGLKWQSTTEIPAPERLGFSRLRGPAATEGVAGYIRWLRPVEHEEPPYYSQTSTFTCGAVSALLASEIRGSTGVDGIDREKELHLWGQANNYPACEPIGLAVALRESLADADGSSPVEVFLDAEGPVLLEHYSEGFDSTIRAALQADSLTRALQSDISVRRDRVSVEELAERVGAGELALLLISTAPMYGFAVPHWVLAHAAADGVVLVDDPWISMSWGETWVDAHEVPIALADLDRMVAWGDDGYRGVVFLRRD
jgi:hypothetical protein